MYEGLRPLPPAPYDSLRGCVDSVCWLMCWWLVPKEDEEAQEEEKEEEDDVSHVVIHMLVGIIGRNIWHGCLLAVAFGKQCRKRIQKIQNIPSMPEGSWHPPSKIIYALEHIVLWTDTAHGTDMNQNHDVYTTKQHRRPFL